MSKLFGTGALLFIQLNFFPNVSLLVVLFFVMALDFVTGVIRSRVKKVARTSEGYRRTISKFTQYAFGLLASYSLAYVANQKGGEAVQQLTPYLVDGLAGFLIFIEVASIFENLYQMDSKSPMARYFFAPVLKVLTFQLKNNPVIKAAEEIKEQK